MVEADHVLVDVIGWISERTDGAEALEAVAAPHTAGRRFRLRPGGRTDAEEHGTGQGGRERISADHFHRETPFSGRWVGRRWEASFTGTGRVLTIGSFAGALPKQSGED